MDKHLAFLVFRDLCGKPNCFRLRIAVSRVPVITFAANCPAIIALNYMLILSHVIDSFLSPNLLLGTTTGSKKHSNSYSPLWRTVKNAYYISIYLVDRRARH